MEEQVDGTAPVKFCQFCGHQLTPKGKFCGKCGKPRPVETVAPIVVEKVVEPVIEEAEVVPPVIEAPVIETPVVITPPVIESTPESVPVTLEAEIQESVKPVIKKVVTKKTVVAKKTVKPADNEVTKSDAEAEKEPEELAGYLPTKAAGKVRTSLLDQEEESINARDLHEEILGTDKKASRAPLIVGVIGVIAAVIAIGVGSSNNSSSDLSAQSPSGVVSSDVPQPAPTSSDTPSKPTPSPSKSVNSACVINDHTVSDLVDYANLARSVPGGSNDKNNAPVIVQWAQDAASLASSISSDAGRSSGSVVSSLRKAATDMNSLSALALSWGQNNVTDSNFVNDYSNGKDAVQSDYKRIASACAGKVPGL